MRARGERGAAAVEFGLVLPILLLLVLGIVEFGRAYNAQISLTSAAREGVRVMAIQNDPAAAAAATLDAAPSLSPALTAGDVTVTPAACTSGDPARVEVDYRLDFVAGLFGSGVDLQGTGVMQCGG